jgi:hypothetical protein
VIGGTEPGTSATSTKTVTSALATPTSNNTTYAGQVYTGAGTSFRGKASVSLWLRLGGWAWALQLAGVLS